MKAILEFNLNDLDDKVAHLRCVKSTSLALVIWNIQYNLKKNLEAELETKTFNKFETLDFVFEKLNKLIEEHRIVIDELLV